jgi:hypothetical protein
LCLFLAKLVLSSDNGCGSLAKLVYFWQKIT